MRPAFVNSFSAFFFVSFACFLWLFFLFFFLFSAFFALVSLEEGKGSPPLPPDFEHTEMWINSEPSTPITWFVVDVHMTFMIDGVSEVYDTIQEKKTRKSETLRENLV